MSNLIINVLCIAIGVLADRLVSKLVDEARKDRAATDASTAAVYARPVATLASAYPPSVPVPPDGPARPQAAHRANRGTDQRHRATVYVSSRGHGIASHR